MWSKILTEHCGNSATSERSNKPLLKCPPKKQRLACHFHKLIGKKTPENLARKFCGAMCIALG